MAAQTAAHMVTAQIAQEKITGFDEPRKNEEISTTTIV
jgi:hypothetical protein